MQILIWLYVPFALVVLWVITCLFIGRDDLVPKFISRWFSQRG